MLASELKMAMKDSDYRKMLYQEYGITAVKEAAAEYKTEEEKD